MTEDTVIELAKQAKVKPLLYDGKWAVENLDVFAALVAAHEKNKVARWMMDRSYATGHGDTVEDLLKELEWQVAEREREECARVCDERADEDGWEGSYATNCAAAIRSRT